MHDSYGNGIIKGLFSPKECYTISNLLAEPKMRLYKIFVYCKSQYIEVYIFPYIWVLICYLYSSYHFCNTSNISRYKIIHKFYMFFHFFEVDIQHSWPFKQKVLLVCQKVRSLQLLLMLSQKILYGLYRLLETVIAIVTLPAIMEIPFLGEWNFSRDTFSNANTLKNHVSCSNLAKR